MTPSIYYVLDRLRGKVFRRCETNPNGKKRARNLHNRKGYFLPNSAGSSAKKFINERVGRFVGGALALLLFLLVPVVYAKPVVIVTGVTVKPDGTYYKEIPVGHETVILVKVQNTENATFRYNVYYNGPLASMLKQGTTVLGSGTVYTTQYLTINPNEVHVLYLVYNPSSAGISTNQIKFHFERKTENNTWENAGDTLLSLQLRVTGSSTSNNQQSSGSSHSSSSTSHQQSTNQCLTLLRNKIYKVVYLNDSLDISIGIMNACNDEIKIVDADLEGVPIQVAYIKDAELGKLDPGEVTYLKVHFSSKPFTEPTTVSFDLIVTAKHGTSLEHDSANINVNVISEKQLSYLPQIKQHEEENTAKPLFVDYSVQSNYLIVKGVYYLENNTKIYLKNVPVDVLYDNQRYAYMGPIPVKPGKTYCIAASAEGYVSFFKCITVPKEKMCVSLKPEGIKKGDSIYYEVGTNVTVDSVYECNSAKPVDDYKIIYDDKVLDKNAFTVSEGNKPLKIVADGYEDLTMNVYGYVPLRIVSRLPDHTGNFTLKLSGTFSNEARVSVAYKDPKTGEEKEIFSGVGPSHHITIKKPGTYILVIKTPVDEIKRTFHVEKGGSSGIPFKTLLMLPLIVVIAFLAFTVFLYFLVRKHRGESLSSSIESIGKMLK
jgi:hypothetical protein